LVEEECKLLRPGNVLMNGKNPKEYAQVEKIRVNNAITKCSKQASMHAFIH
jgi:hypothetical protein